MYVQQNIINILNKKTHPSSDTLITITREIFINNNTNMKKKNTISCIQIMVELCIY